MVWEIVGLDWCLKLGTKLRTFISDVSLVGLGTLNAVIDS